MVIRYRLTTIVLNIRRPYVAYFYIWIVPFTFYSIVEREIHMSNFISQQRKLMNWFFFFRTISLWKFLKRKDRVQVESRNTTVTNENWRRTKSMPGRDTFRIKMVLSLVKKKFQKMWITNPYSFGIFLSFWFSCNNEIRISSLSNARTRHWYRNLIFV